MPPSPTRSSQLKATKSYYPIIALIVLNGLFFFVLINNGYTPLTDHGRPRTIDPNDKGWSIGQIGQSDWQGGHCPRVKWDGTVRGGGRDSGYMADSHLCTAAAHAGVLTTTSCFEYRLFGEQPYFNGTYQNGILSRDFGWFSQSIEFRPATGAIRCTDTKWVINFVVWFGFFVLVWQIPTMWYLHLTVQWGFYYAALAWTPSSGQFWLRVNDLAKKEFLLVPMTIVLFHFFFIRPMAPLEALILHSTLFWAFIHLRDYEYGWGINLSFTPSGLAQHNSLTIGVLVGICLVAIPLTILQVRTLWSNQHLHLYLLGILVCILYVVLIQTLEPGVFAPHVHHFMIGLFLCVAGKGRRWYNILIQAIGLALFVEGLAVYDVAPLMDQVGSPQVGYGAPPDQPLVPVPVWTRVYHNGTLVTMEWALACTNETNVDQPLAYVTRNGIPQLGVFNGSFTMDQPGMSVFTVHYIDGPANRRLPVTGNNWSCHDKQANDDDGTIHWYDY